MIHHTTSAEVGFITLFNEFQVIFSTNPELLRPINIESRSKQALSCLSATFWYHSEKTLRHASAGVSVTHTKLESSIIQSVSYSDIPPSK